MKIAAFVLGGILLTSLGAQETAVPQDTSSARPDYDPQKIGRDVKPPTLINRIDPTYPRKAQKAKLEGTVLLRIIVDRNGVPTRVEVKKGVFDAKGNDLGLNDKAVEAVKQWRFSPGTRDGKPVAVIATIEVNFRLR